MQSSGTGVYYQAIPAMGADGKNLMTLIPVKKVNGQFVRIRPLPAKQGSRSACTAPVSLPQNGFPTVKPIADGRFILQTPLEVNTVLTPVNTEHQKATMVYINTANQVHTPLAPQKITRHNFQLATQADKAVTVTESPQVTNAVKIPMFTSGHYLQIPHNAMVKTLPASALPLSIKNRVCSSTNASSNSANNLPMVVYVSPVISVKLDQKSPSLTSSAEVQPTLGQTPVASSVDQSVTFSPRPNQEGNTPMKWVVQERTGDSAPYLIPVSSPNMTTDILKAVKQMKSVRHENEVTIGDDASLNQEKVNPGKDNALVMCNGKVFFVAKKNGESPNNVSTKDVSTKDVSMHDVSTNAGNKMHHRNAAQPSATILGSSAFDVAPKQDPKNTETSKKTSDIIDLCGDDDDGITCTQPVEVTVSSETESDSEEDSNVIFVSYIPPKAVDAGTTEKGTAAASTNTCTTDTDACKLGTGITDKGSEVTGPSSTDCDGSKSAAAEPAPESTEAQTEQPELISNDEHHEKAVDAGTTEKGTAAASTNTCTTDMDSEVTGPSSTDCDGSKSAAAEPAPESTEAQTEQPELISNDEHHDAEKTFEKTDSDQNHRPKSDSELRRIFGIVSDLRISLQKINVFEKSLPQEETRFINKRTLEGIRKMIRDSKIETKIKQIIQDQVSSPKSEQGGPQDIKRPRLEEDEGNNNPKTSSFSSILPNTLACDVEMQSASTEQSTDSTTIETPQDLEYDVPSAKAVCEDPKQATSLPSSTPISETVQTQNANAHKNSHACCTELRKPLPRQSRGSGRVCTACPCGTKVGGVAAYSSTKPQEMQNTSSSTDASETSKGATTVVVNSVSKPSSGYGQSGKSGDNLVHSNPSHNSKDMKRCAPTVASSTSQPVSDGESSAEESCSSSVEPTQHTTERNIRNVPETATHTQKPNLSASRRQSNNVHYKIPCELYSSVVLDPEEIKRQERINRLKDLLRQKEAELEKLRKSM